MSHRALQIVDAIAGLIPASPESVFKHRVLSLSESDQELPAHSVEMGEDEPLDENGVSNLAFIDSLLRVTITSLVTGDDEQAVAEKLMELRTKQHTALMSNRELGLSFVIDTRYAGAGEIECELNEAMTGRLVTHWDVHYRMNITDPS